MFWGLIMEPQKRYSQVVKKPFHISMAALDASTSSGEPSQIMCGFDNRKYLLCTLTKDGNPQCALDLNFDVGSEVSFIANGNGHVHLSGYLVHDDEALFAEEDDEESDAAEEEETTKVEDDLSLGTIDPKAIVTGKRQKAAVNQNGLTGTLGKKLAALAATAPPAKKLKTMDMLNNLPDEDEDEDEDFSLTQFMEEEDDDGEDETIAEEDEDDELDEEEESDDDDMAELGDSENVELDEEVEEEESEEEEEEEVKVPPKSNGTKKGKKEKENKKKKQPESNTSPKAKNQLKQEAKSPKKTIEGGVIVEELRPGSGAAAKGGKMVQVYYEGRLKSNNKVFDSSLKGNGFKFRLGRGEVIKGWDVGVVGMKVGGKRRIVCPPPMAYGKKGSPPTIPPNSTLIFDVELRNVN